MSDIEIGAVPPSESRAATTRGLVGAHGETPLRALNEQPSPEIQSVARALARIRTGIELSLRAARILMIAVVLLPLELRDYNDEEAHMAALHTVDETWSGAQSGRSLSAAVQDGFLSLDLAGACLFSWRHFASTVVRHSAGTLTPQSETTSGSESILQAKVPLAFDLNNSEITNINMFP